VDRDLLEKLLHGFDLELDPGQRAPLASILGQEDSLRF
jgi:hypothetical protein